MRGFLAVLRREIAERWLLVLAALLLGLVPLTVPFLPMGSIRGPEARAGTALALALIVSFVLALVLGSSVLARDLAERRLGFYFSRPLQGWAIWAGKLAAAVLLAFGSGVLVLLPSRLLGDRLDPSGYWGQGPSWESASGQDTVLWVASVLALLLLANAVSVMVRSRSPWLLLDLLAATGLVGLVWVLTLRLLLNGAFGAVSRAQSGLLAAFILSLTLASAAQVTRARTDLRQGHRVLSLTLWGLLGLSVLVFGGYGSWVLSAGPEDLVRIEDVQTSPAGDWIGVGGAVRSRAGFEPYFLFDAASGRSLRIPVADRSWNRLAFSRDGRRAVWLEAEGGHRFFPLIVHRMDLDRPGASPVAERIGFSSQLPDDFALSPDGTRLAAIHQHRVQVHELGTGRLLMSQGTPAEEIWGGDRLRFLDARTLRLLGSRRTGDRTTLDAGVVVVDFDVETGRVAREREVSREGHLARGMSADGQRLLLRSRMFEKGRFAFQIADLRTGELSPPILLPGPLQGAGFLRDGRLVAASARGRRSFVQILDGRGGELRRVELPGSLVRLGGQPTPGLLAVGTAAEPRSNDRSHWRAFLLDLDRGALRPLGEGLSPVGWPGLPVGSPGTKLFREGMDRLVRIDPVTGSRRAILRPE